MTDELLVHYEHELGYLRKLGAEFARSHPKIAGRLRIGPDTVEDPHVSRLIESVALLNARIRQKLDDDFPEVPQALLSVLYPHYLAPIPSMAIAQLIPQADLATGYEVPVGTVLETAPVDGAECRFRTCSPVVLWPLEIENVKLSGRPLLAPHVPTLEEAEAALRITLRCSAPDATFAGLGPRSLRFYLRGEHRFATRLFELVHNDVIGVALAAGPDDPRPAVLDASAVRSVGFDADDPMLPSPPTSFAAYGLLTEFFTFPQRFLFFDVEGFEPKALTHAGASVDVFLYLRRSNDELERDIARDSIALGCTPIVNLYSQRAESIDLTHLQSEYRVVPDSRRPFSTEVYSVDHVIAVSPEGDEEEYVPFYSARHAPGDGVRHRFWHATRRPAPSIAGRDGSGTDVFLSLVDLDLRPSVPDDWVLEVRTTCLNRDVPSQLPFGGGEPRLRLSSGAAPLEDVRCLTQPTPTLRPDLGGGAQWRLVSHLVLNHLSLSSGDDAAEALREILCLYDFRDSPQTRATIDGVARVRCRPSSARVPGARHGGVCRGTDVHLDLDPRRFAGSEMFLFACVLERFFALYASINSFTRTVARVQGREGVLRRWPPRAGRTTLI